MKYQLEKCTIAEFIMIVNVKCTMYCTVQNEKVSSDFEVDIKTGIILSPTVVCRTAVTFK